MPACDRPGNGRAAHQAERWHDIHDMEEDKEDGFDIEDTSDED